MVIACIAIDDVEILNLLEVMLGSIGSEDRGHAWVKTTSEDGSESCLLETLTICPLPAVFEVSLILWLIVGSIHIVDTSFEAGIHDGEVLIRKSEVDAEFWLELLHQSHESRNIVCIDRCSSDVSADTVLGVQATTDGIGKSIALRLCAACNADVGKDVGILSQLVCCYGAYTSTAD